MKLHVNTDGGIVTGPFGPNGEEVTMTSIAYVIRNPRNGQILEEFGRMTGKEGTNNDAEYEAAIMGIARCVELGATDVVLHVDSQMVKGHVTREYRCNHDHLRAHMRHLKSHAKQIKSFEVKWVKREHNRRADELCNRAMDLFRHQHGLPSRVEARQKRAAARRKWKAMSNAERQRIIAAGGGAPP